MDQLNGLQEGQQYRYTYLAHGADYRWRVMSMVATHVSVDARGTVIADLRPTAGDVRVDNVMSAEQLHNVYPMPPRFVRWATDHERGLVGAGGV